MQLEAKAARRAAVAKLVPGPAKPVRSDAIRIVVDRREVIARRDESARE